MRFSYILSARSFPSSRRLIHTTVTHNRNVWQVWGSNTAVGKTVLSAALLRHANSPSLYLKPIQTGYPVDDDSAFVSRLATKAQTLTLYTYEQPVSPDLAASLDNLTVSDQQICYGLTRALSKCHAKDSEQSQQSELALVETAGGVLSPAPSGTVQADLYRRFRYPALLVGDSRLGGISATLSAYEALRNRGYDVPVVVMFAESEGALDNEQSVQKHVHHTTQVFRAPCLPPQKEPLNGYLQDPYVESFFQDLGQHLKTIENDRINHMKTMKKNAKDIIWYPFTQHSQIQEVMCIDSAHDNHYTTYDAANGLQSIPDTAGGWWTNGVGHGNPAMAKAVGNAVGRYGHVLFPENIHEPAYRLAERLLDGVGRDWATRVFYSDNGSTALEVALKMAFRKRQNDKPELSDRPMKIIGLEGCYHGDTLGVMSCAAESDFNTSQTPWYQPRGLFFDPPTACLKGGVWMIRTPKWIGDIFDITLKNREELFSSDRNVSFYENAIRIRLQEALAREDCDFGALLLEPVMLASGGMTIVDPAFQRTLVNECRREDIPIVFDEVFSGLWRLGCEGAGSMIGCVPDVAAYGKLLTGGTVPLAATLATEDVFRKFEGNSKRDALLHGHSFSAHAVGCAAGVEAFRQYQLLAKTFESTGTPREYWSEDSAKEMSCMPRVEGVALAGTVISVELSSSEQGYAAGGAREVVELIKRRGIFARPLGNVVYMMCNPLTDRQECDAMMRVFMDVLERWTSGQKERETPAAARAFGTST